MSDILIIPNRGTTSAPEIQFSGSANSSASIKLQVLPEGQVAFLGKSGSLFSITDSMAGSLMAVSDISGLPILEVSSDDKVVMGTFNKPAMTVTGSAVHIGYTGSLNGLALTVGNSYGKIGSVKVIDSSEATIDLDNKFMDSVNGLRTVMYSNNGAMGIVVYKGSGYGGASNYPLYYYAGATPSADVLYMQSGGSDAITINGSQNVAIGKNSPINGRLDVSGNTRITGSLGISSATATSIAATSTTGTILSGTVSSGTDRYFLSFTGAANSFTLYENSSTPYLNSYAGMVLRANQLGGSGGTINLTGGNINLSQNTTISSNAAKTVSDTPLTIGTATGGASDYQLVINRSANGTGAYYNIQSVEQGISYRDLVLQKDGGNVGIRKLSPNATLDVSGTAIISGSLTVTGVLTAPTSIESLRANRNISGGGTIAVDGSGYVSWGTRFIVISNGYGSNFTTNGYFDITCPTSGTITGVGGAANATATSAGIPLSAWQALYYILPIGSSNTSLAANFRIASYTSTLDIPAEWVLICLRNGDNGYYYFANGMILASGESGSTGLQTSTNTANTIVRRDGSGNFSAATATLSAMSITGLISSTATEGLRINQNNGYISIYNTAGSTRTGYLQGNTASDVTLAAENGAVLAFNTNGSEKMRIDTTGYVGIGTTSPGEMLELKRSNGAGNIGIRFHEPGVVEYKMGICDSDDKFYITNNNGPTAIGSNATGIVLQSNGNVGIGTSSPSYPLHVYSSGQSSVAIETASRKWGILTNTSWASNGFSIYDLTADVSRVFVDTSGNVGIGTNSPSTTLHVSGNARITGAIYDSSNSAGTSGQVLTSTGTGTSWSAAASSTTPDFSPIFMLMGA